MESNLKNDTNELIYKIETESQIFKKMYGYQRRNVEGGINQKFGINRYTLLYMKEITNKSQWIAQATLLNIL